jgi:hypothetical protein
VEKFQLVAVTLLSMGKSVTGRFIPAGNESGYAVKACGKKHTRDQLAALAGRQTLARVFSPGSDSMVRVPP